jgi:hypothetical protein
MADLVRPVDQLVMQIVDHSLLKDSLRDGDQGLHGWFESPIFGASAATGACPQRVHPGH